MSDATGSSPRMWGSSIVGFGQYHYTYASGRQGSAPLTGFSSRKRNITLYILSGFDDYQRLLERFGKYKTGKACLYITALADVDCEALRELIGKSVEHIKRTNAA